MTSVQFYFNGAWYQLQRTSVSKCVANRYFGSWQAIIICHKKMRWQ